MELELQKRIASWGQLGAELKQIVSQDPLPDDFEAFLRTVESKNGWFTREQVLHALNAWTAELQADSLKSWLRPYAVKTVAPKTIAVIAAGNIPLVGLHDALSVLMSGHKLQIKLSSSDPLLLPFLFDRLIAIEPAWADFIEVRKDAVRDYDAVIATGSDNTARYFSHYFKDKPHIIRKNRNSVAVLSGDESEAELSGLANDIFRYYGLGCRSVSKLFVPEGYDFDKIFKAVYPWKHLLAHKKYENNYDYNKAVFLMSQFDFLENGFFMIKEDASMASPIASVFYETYSNTAALEQKLDEQKEQIQCIVGGDSYANAIPFGKSQQPGLSDYADGVDTLDFLLKL
ncbi:acyl-CoA reductase [Gilvibacter sediminis]|uniref:acyl-CoA reductase n=1 Tax=Gilvibacter sediminis TaxID=379071 RepID=UPI002350CE05|nr:acyl-CoA reductase [Gilvibacter sediminis]MDC7998246.1 acyl-CoA reductase [Gilvibacter sediminis]